MYLTERVREVQEKIRQKQAQDPDTALLQAERLADLYSDVKPVQYIVPIERLTGVPTPSRQTKKG